MTAPMVRQALTVASVPRTGPFYELGHLSDPADHVGTAVAEVSMVAPLSRRELVTALSMTLSLTVDDLADMSTRQVLLCAARTLLFHGLLAVEETAARDLDEPPADPSMREFLAVCERRIDQALRGEAVTQRP